MGKKSKGILFMLISAFLYALMNVFIKIANDIPLFERLFFTNLVTFLIAYFLVRKNKASLVGKRDNQRDLFIRSILGLVAMITNFYAISKLPIADSSMLNKLSPFFVTLFACFFLKEKLNKIQIPTLVIVFIASLLVIKPKFSMEMVPALSGFMSAVFSGAAYTAISYIGDREDSSTIVAHFALVSMVGTFIPMLLDFKVPNLKMIGFLICIGLCYGFAQVTMTIAYKFAPAGEVSIYNYSNILFASILGFAIFHEVPDKLSLLGGLIILLSAVTLFVYDKKRFKDDKTIKQL